jgi:hypothetical protein
MISTRIVDVIKTDKHGIAKKPHLGLTEADAWMVSPGQCCNHVRSAVRLARLLVQTLMEPCLKLAESALGRPW